MERAGVIGDAAAEAGGPDHLGVDDEWAAAVVGCEVEADGSVGVEEEAAGDGFVLSWLVDMDVAVEGTAVGGIEDEVAGGVEPLASGAAEGEADEGGVGTGGDDPVVLQLAILPVDVEVDAGEEGGVAEAGEVAARGVGADGAGGGWELHSKGFARGEVHGDGGGGEGDRVVWAAGGEAGGGGVFKMCGAVPGGGGLEEGREQDEEETAGHYDCWSQYRRSRSSEESPGEHGRFLNHGVFR